MVNPEIKDKVYIEGHGWINDYFLTDAKNAELKNLRSDLTTTNNDLKADIESLQKYVDLEIKRATDVDTTLNDKITQMKVEAAEANNELESKLSRAINDNTALIESNKQLAQDNLDNLNTTLAVAINTTNQAVSQNKQAIEKEVSDRATAIAETKDSLTKSMSDLDKSLRDEIASQVEGSNKWYAGSPVDNKEMLDQLELDDSFNWLCKVADTGYTWQRIAGQTTWNEYSTNIDYIDPNELETALNTHNTSTTSHSDIRTNLETLSNNFNTYKNSTDESLNLIGSDIVAIQNKNTQQDTSISSLQTDLSDVNSSVANINESIGNIQSQYVKKVSGKDLSTNDFSNEYKSKLDAINTSEYEKVSNKTNTIASDTDGNKYPTVAAVKTYVAENIVGGSSDVDLSNYVKLSGDSQNITASTTFANNRFHIGSSDTELYSFGVNDNNYIEIYSDNANTLQIANIITESIMSDSADINLNTLKINDVEYDISSTVSDTVLATTRFVQNAVNSIQASSSSDTQTVNNYAITAESVEVLNSKLNGDYIIPRVEGFTVVVLNCSLSYTDEDGSVTTIEKVPLEYTFDGSNWVAGNVPVFNIFYSQSVATVGGLSTGLAIYSVNAQSDGKYTCNKIYPSDTSNYATKADLNNYVLTSTYNTLSDTVSSHTSSINSLQATVNTLQTTVNAIPNTYVKQISLTNTLASYVTTNSLTSTLSSYVTISAMNTAIQEAISSTLNTEV